MPTTRRTRGSWIGGAAVLVAALLPAVPAYAEYHPSSSDEALFTAGAVVAVLAPGDVGVLVSGTDPSIARFVLGWSWQLPLPLHDGGRHRIVPSFDLLPQADPSWRVRVGYRYSRRYLFAGAGLDVAGSQASVAPELGAKFAHWGDHDDVISPSLHIITRAEIDPSSGDLRGVAILLGWNLI